MKGESPITVDDLRVAQFLYLMLSNDKLRATIDAVSRKIVLILGRFLPARKIVLNAIREALRTKGYIPILFDFSKPAGKTFIETVSIFAHLSRFVIADFFGWQGHLPRSAAYRTNNRCTN